MIFNEVKGFRVPRKRLDGVFSAFLKKEKIEEKFSVSLVFIGGARMRELNEKWRGAAGATDVLSFNYGAGGGAGAGGGVGTGVGIGEIYICVEVAGRNARIDESSLADEILKLFAHGLLHLIGYTHETEKKYKVMMERVEDILR